MTFALMEHLQQTKPMIPARSQPINDFNIDAAPQLIKIYRWSENFDFLMKPPWIEFIATSFGFLHLAYQVHKVVVVLQHCCQYHRYLFKTCTG